MVFTFLENALNLGIFTHAPVPHSKLQAKFFENLFPPTAERSREIMICFVKIQSEKIEMAWYIRLFTFCMICNFSKWHRRFVNNNLWFSVVLSFLLLLCNHDNLTLKFHQKHSFLIEGWLLIERIKVGSLQRMINKEVLAQFICKPI